ncbi:PREDICTED: leucine-rich repeat and IQ domain-containing protein 1 [Nanorana parkeri]|uniref:leucine-rich repeat and IQ domain-containing protein 1 n=1 Tax=Nanorana parkeri TaxID=125878 RepID=UPI0008550834|nr:PREDICTED: leucine-rich repeat and IQ domain-containing protein 1 [Nanorana parkeri]
MGEAIEQELNQVSLPDKVEGESMTEDTGDDYGSLTDIGENEVKDELPDSVLSCLQFLKQRNEKAEKIILQDLEYDSSKSEDITGQFSKPLKDFDSDFLDELASEYNEEPEALIKRVLADIEEDDKLAPSSSDIAENTSGLALTEETVNSGDGSLESISFCYIKVEESCRQKLQQWEKEQEKHNEMKRAALIAQKAVLENEIQEQDEKRENWKMEFAKELLRLNALQKEQQEKLDADLKIKNDTVAGDLRNHQNLIKEMEAELVKEQNIFKEQKARARKYLEELHNKSAVKIQTAFRAHRIYKMYAPVLRQKKEELKRKKEMQEKMDQERKEFEEKVKLKLEEKKRRDEEKRLNEEIAKKKLEEAKRLEHLEQERRQQTYEKKKEEEKQRLEKAKILKLEAKKKSETIVSTDTFNNEHLGKIKNKHSNPCLQVIEKTVEDSCKDGTKQAKHSEMVKKPMEEIYEEKTLAKQCKVQQQVNIDGCAINIETLTDLEPEKEPKEISNNYLISTENSSLAPNRESKEKQDKGACDMPSLTPKTQTPLLKETVDVACSETAHGSQDREKNTGSDLQNKSPALPMNSRSLVLPDHIEERRLTWMKSCKPWSTVLRENRLNSVVRKTRQRKRSAAKTFPPINTALILKNGPWNNLQQVTTVTLHDLPGCSLSTLSNCDKLKYLSLRHCMLTALDGISNCKQLQYIDVQENCINVINCEDLENLTALLLNKNQITSIHGLDNCTNLRNLELSFNSITRISGLNSLRNLQRLVLDHNRLISTRGLEATPLLTYLDCSYNYLTELEGIQNCGLLQILKLLGNNLTEIPKFNNHVLLRELYLDDNNITTLRDMPSYWLPLMQMFSISKNSLTHLAPFNSFISLEHMDLSNNCLSELGAVSLSLDGCVSLSRLGVSKNPFLQEANWRGSLLKVLPKLRFLDDEEIHLEDFTPHSPCLGSFLALCQTQIFNICKLWKKLNIEEGTCSSPERLDLYCDTLKELLKLSSNHRYAHEYGDTESSERADPVFASRQHNNPVISNSNEDKHDHTWQNKDCENAEKKDLVENSRTAVQSLPLVNSINVSENATHSDDLRKTLKTHRPGEIREIQAAILIQSLWRGYVVRRDIHHFTKLHEAASIIQSAWSLYCGRTKTCKKKHCAKMKVSDIKHQAATIIQAAWRGFFLRKKLAAALAAIERDELDDFYEEVNLNHFMFDENVMENDWSLDSTASHHETIHLSSKAEQAKKSGIPENRAHPLPWIPQEAWAVSEASSLHSQVRENRNSRLEKQNLSHVSSMKSNIDISFKSEKEEKISQEWGFKDAATVQLMLKRAQKMKSKQAKHKRMLDPAVRLALFKNNENKRPPVKPPKTTQITKTEYFRGLESWSQNELSLETLARSKELTYEWLHTQCVDVESTHSTTPKCKRFLPELNHDVLNGGRVQLVANTLSREADDLDLVSVKSGSTLSQYRGRNLEIQRNTSPPPSSASNRNAFTPVKTNSGPQRKERISFRDNPVLLSGGWGGGKKKGKSFK